MVTNPARRRSIIGLTAAVAAAMVLLTGCGGGSEEPAASASASGSAVAAAGMEVLLDAQQLTILDQPIEYPKKRPAQISSSIVQLEPGQETGWHKYKAPMFAYVLEGTVTVEYDAGVTKEYPAGTALVEAVNVWQNGTNQGSDPVRILVVNMGAKGVKNSVDRTP